MKELVTRYWYTSVPAPWYLRSLSALFGLVARIRRRRQQGQARLDRPRAPVIVVGNIAVGGTGKTPFVIWLVARLREWGWHPGVVSRGYGGRARRWPQPVTRESDPALVGDEPVMIAQRTDCPLVVGPDRVAAVQLLLNREPSVDIVVSDDGLQHYRLWRDFEIAVVDATRGLGNGALLPVGPLREPPERLGEVGLVVANGSGWTSPAVPAGRQVNIRLYALEARALTGGARKPLAEFAGKSVHAVAGIGNPARFFSMLSQLGIHLMLHPFPDHHPFCAADLDFGDDLPVLMTEKDAVKCRGLAGDKHWVVPVEAGLGPEGVALVQELTRPLRRS
jgi:tetraacyldisaccharide 4'-kinase